MLKVELFWNENDIVLPTMIESIETVESYDVLRCIPDKNGFTARLNIKWLLPQDLAAIATTFKNDGNYSFEDDM